MGIALFWAPLGWVWLVPLLYFLAVLLGQGVIVWLAAHMPDLTPEMVESGSLPVEVSVIIPARNEGGDLERCLDDLGRQDLLQHGGRMEVVVVDGGSTDGTAASARAHPLAPVVLDEPPLPEGWVGKNWACHQGAARVHGEVLLFLDADVRLHPSAVRAGVSRLRSTGADLVTFAARIEMEGFWERVVMPLFVQFVLLYFLAPRVNLDRSSRAMANGQFMCFSRAGYQRSGGHLGVKGAVLEDVRLAQEVKRRGGRVRIFWAPELLSTRMYSNRREMAEGILKNLHGTRFSALRQIVLASAIFLYFLSPFLAVGLALLGWLPAPWLLFSLLLVLLTAVKQVGFQRAVDVPLRYGLLYPVGCVYYLGLFARSLAQGLRGGKVTWKGRTYDMDA